MSLSAPNDSSCRRNTLNAGSCNFSLTCCNVPSKYSSTGGLGSKARGLSKVSEMPRLRSPPFNERHGPLPENSAIRGSGWIIDGVRDLRIVGLREFGATKMGLSREAFEGVVVGWRMRFGYGMQVGQMEG